MHRVNRIMNHLSNNQQSQLVANDTACAGDCKKKEPVVVCVTGACGNIAYSIIFMIAQGKMLGADQPIELRLLDIPPMADAIKGVMMEVADCAFPLVTKVVGTTDYKEAFDGIDIAMLIGARPRGPGMVRADLLKANAGIFKGQGQALDKYAKKTVKVLVVGNPANTNALIAATYAPSIPKSNFGALTRLDQNRAAGMLATRLKVPVSSIKNVVIWGNHSATQVPDVNHGYVEDYPTQGFRTSIRAAVADDAWLDGQFCKSVQTRGKAIITARKKSSAASAANAAVDSMRSWFCGTPAGEWVNLATYTDGAKYGIEGGIMCSMPITHANGQATVVEGLKIDSNTQGLINKTVEELVGERSAALQ